MDIKHKITQRANGLWVLNLVVDGKRRQLTAHSKLEAQMRLKSALKELEQEAKEARAQLELQTGPYTLHQALQQGKKVVWTGDKPDDRSALTMAEQVVYEILGPSKPVEEITYADGEKVIEWGKARNNKASTINNRLCRLRKLQEIGLKYGGIKFAAQLPKNLKRNNIQLQTFTSDQIKRTAACLYGRGKHDEARLFVFLNEMGCRFSEAMRLKGKDIDLERGTVTFFKTIQDNKTGNRLLRLTPRALEMVQQQIPPLPSQKLWLLKYDDFYKDLTGALDEMGINMPRPIHTARHTCGSKLGRAGLGDFEIRDWLGHSSTATTNRYVHLNASALDRCWEVLANEEGK